MNKGLLLITGASSDIGLCLIRRLAQGAEPPTILAHCHSGEARIGELVGSLREISFHSLCADFSSPDAVKAFAERVAGDFGVPDQIVHTAGVKLRYERFTRFDDAHFARDMQVQVHAAVTLLKRFLPAMAKMPVAQVVFLLSSVTRAVPPRYMSMYTMVKYAQLGLMRALASEYSETAVCVNAVSPGMVETRFLDDIPELVREKNAASIPKKRNATPDDVVDAIEFLLARRSGYLTGVEIPVAGGAVF